MTESVQVALIVAVPGTLLGVAALVTAMRGNRKVEQTRALVQTVELSLNSRLSQLLESTAKSARSEGMAEERAAGASRAADAAVAVAGVTAEKAVADQRAAEQRTPD
jgi:hypothetical protein